MLEWELDTCMIYLLLGGDIERRTECRKMQIRHFVIEIRRNEIDVVLVGLKPARSPSGQRGRRKRPVIA